MLHMTLRCLNVPTSHQKDEKVDFSSNFGVYLASFLTIPKILKNFFRVQQKTGGNLSKIQTLAFEEGSIDVLSKKVKIIRVRQVEPSIEYFESGKRKRLFEIVERHFGALFS